jgi:hypothetical protein
MAVELVVLLEEGATEEQVRTLANIITMAPVTVGVWRHEVPGGQECRITHDSSDRTQ